MPRVPYVMLFALSVCLTLVTGCQERAEEAKPVETPSLKQTAAGVEQRRARVVIPADVRGKWKAVKIAVRDKESGVEAVYVVDIGSELTVPDTEIMLRVNTFLPAFIMDGTVMTSASNEPKNPGVQIIIREKGEDIFKGWLFSLYPGAHAFQHPRYSFSLVDYIAKK